ncbi:hypothetical protein B0919_24535 [Hymenobacter sp. CRA2]|nr:hypothetical protein B0919_24535 [Hymenobacter sp. CRA2]
MDDIELGSIDLKPVRATYAANLVHLRTDNQLLYSSELLPTIRQFLTDFQLELHNYSRLDIAIDTNAYIMKRFDKYFYKPDEYHLHTNNRQIHKLNAFGSIERTGETNATIYLAQNVNGRSLKLYNKSLEIHESSHKDYISEYHKANGVNPLKEVWRLELTITNDAVKKYEKTYRLHTDYNTELSEYHYKRLEPAEQTLYYLDKEVFPYTPDFDRLQDAQHLLELFKHFSGNLAEFRKKDSSNKTRCTHMPLIYLPDNIAELKPNQIYRITKSKYEENNMKNTVKVIFEQFAKHHKTSYLEVAKELADDNNLTEYYNALCDKYASVISTYNNSLTNYSKPSAFLF